MIIDHISQETGANPVWLDLLIRSAGRRYKTYFIKKRTGGLREINQPSPAIKFLQRWVVRNYISHLPVHSQARAYREGVGIAENARVHASKNYLLKMDFQNFFPSIRAGDVRNLLIGNLANQALAELNDSDLNAIVRIVCRGDALTIGAPSSPAISNAVLHQFDTVVANRCTELGVTYTRYADDLAFSADAPNVLSLVHDFVQTTLAAQISPRLTINQAKTVFTSKKHRRSVTGLVLTSNSQVSIGRKQKRVIKALCFKFANGELSLGEGSYLSGYLSYVNSVEPSFLQSLRQKYGSELVERISAMVPVQRKPF